MYHEGRSFAGGRGIPRRRDEENNRFCVCEKPLRVEAAAARGGGSLEGTANRARHIHMIAPATTSDQARCVYKGFQVCWVLFSMSLSQLSNLDDRDSDSAGVFTGTVGTLVREKCLLAGSCVCYVALPASLSTPAAGWVAVTFSSNIVRVVSCSRQC